MHTLLKTKRMRPANAFFPIRPCWISAACAVAFLAGPAQGAGLSMLGAHGGAGCHRHARTRTAGRLAAWYSVRATARPLSAHVRSPRPLFRLGQRTAGGQAAHLRTEGVAVARRTRRGGQPAVCG